VAKLPDATELGSPSGFISGRPISSYDPSARSRGLVAMGEGVGQLAVTLERDATREKTATDNLQLAQAKSDFLVAKTNISSEFDGDTNPENMPTRFTGGVQNAQAQAATAIQDPRNRQRFFIETNPSVAAANAKAVERQRGLVADREMAGANDRLEQIRQSALKSTDDTERTQLIATGSELIDAMVNKGRLSATKGQEFKRNWVRNYAASAIDLLEPEQRADALRGPAPNTIDGTVSRIIQIESAGNPNARNPLSGATGLGQFISTTWLNTIKQHRPDLAKGRSDAELLALRTDPRIATEMTTAHVNDNASALKANGLDPTPGNLYLAHFLGVGGAVKALKADPNTPAGVITGQAAVNSNRSILEGKTIGSVVAWANQKMGAGPHANLAQYLSEDTRVQKLRETENHIKTQQVQQSQTRATELDRVLIDAAAGKAPLITRQEIELDTFLSEEKRNALLQKYDQAASSVNMLAQAEQRFQASTDKWNPFVKEDRDAADLIFHKLGGNDAALAAVTERTGILPQSVATQIRGDLVSGNPQRVENALNRANNLVAAHPTIISRIEGGDKIQAAAINFRHDVDSLGMTAKEAVAKYIERQMPEYQAKIQTRIKDEDVNEIVKKNLKVSDLTSAFDTKWDFSSPQLGYTPETRQSMFGDYADLFRENYMQTADVSRSKDLAINQLRRVWGVSSVSGNDVIMRYPPEKAPRLQGIANASEHIARQALDSIKEFTGQDVPRSALQIMPIPTLTSGAFKAGQQAPYMLVWSDKNGVIQMLPPGKGFVVDDKKIREKITDQRAEQFPLLQEQNEIMKLVPTVPGIPKPLMDIGAGAGVRTAQKVKQIAGDFIPDEKPSEILKKGVRSIQNRLSKRTSEGVEQ
jgi:hypothetical protein